MRPTGPPPPPKKNISNIAAKWHNNHETQEIKTNLASSHLNTNEPCGDEGFQTLYREQSNTKTRKRKLKKYYSQTPKRGVIYL